MESFFLSETLKYLFLLFDEDNVLHSDRVHFVFSTQVCSSSHKRKSKTPLPYNGADGCKDACFF